MYKWRLWVAVLIILALCIGLAVVATRSSSTADEAGKSSESDEIVQAARQALAAWGEFAVSGDLGKLGDSFATGGPQFQQFQAEAPALAGDPAGAPPYRVDLELAGVVEASGEATVSGIVTFTRSGEPDQSFEWDVVMRKAVNGRWQVWTVESDQKPENTLDQPGTKSVP